MIVLWGNILNYRSLSTVCSTRLSHSRFWDAVLPRRFSMVLPDTNTNCRRSRQNYGVSLFVKKSHYNKYQTKLSSIWDCTSTISWNLHRHLFLFEDHSRPSSLRNHTVFNSYIYVYQNPSITILIQHGGLRFAQTRPWKRSFGFRNIQVDLPSNIRRERSDRGITKEDSDTQHSQSTTSKNLDASKTTVSFGSVCVREYPLILGDSIPSEGGAPLSLDWEPSCERIFLFEDFESDRSKFPHVQEISLQLRLEM